MISEDDFMEIWGAHEKPNGELYSFHEVKHFPLRNIWTVFEDGSVDDDGYSDNNWYAEPGYNPLHALGYVVTEKPWADTTDVAIWYLDTDDFAREERRLHWLKHDGPIET